MISVSIIFFKVIGYLEGAQEAPDLPQAVAPTGTDCAQPRGSERVKTPHHMDFYTKWHMSNSVKFWNQSHGVILNHSNPPYLYGCVFVVQSPAPVEAHQVPGRFEEDEWPELVPCQGQLHASIGLLCFTLLSFLEKWGGSKRPGFII